MPSSLDVIRSRHKFQPFYDDAEYTVVCFTQSENVANVQAFYAWIQDRDRLKLQIITDKSGLREVLSRDEPLLLHVDQGLQVPPALFEGLATAPIILFVECDDYESAYQLAWASSPLVVYVDGSVSSAEFHPFAQALLNAARGGATIQEIADYLSQVSPTVEATLISATPDQTLIAPAQAAAFGPKGTETGLPETESTGNMESTETTEMTHVGNEVQEQLRRLDAAMPDQAYVNQTTEVRAMIALADSAGLRALLPDVTEAGDLIKQDDIHSIDVFVPFPNSGAVVYLQVAANAADFQIDTPSRKLPLRPQRDSSMLTFFLTPKRVQKRGRVQVQVFSDAQLTELLGETVVYTEIVQEESVMRSPQPAERPWRLGIGGIQPVFRPNPLFSLARKISEHFKLSTLHMISRSLSVDPENIPHSIKFEFAYELAELFQLHNQLQLLIDTLRQFNPVDIDWEDGLTFTA